MKISDIMSREVVTIAAKDRVREAFAAMYANHIRQVPVVDEDGAVVGIVTDRDLKEHMGAWIGLESDPEERVEALDDPIDSVMTADPVTIGPDASVGELVDLLLDEKFGGVPVVERGRTLVGIVTYLDVLRAVRDLV
jgi:acetoin utilization protein AcuB